MPGIRSEGLGGLLAAVGDRKCSRCDPVRIDPSSWFLEPSSWNGALAQLGERLLCTQEVIGSIPIGSTRSGARASERGAGEVRR